MRRWIRTAIGASALALAGGTPGVRAQEAPPTAGPWAARERLEGGPLPAGAGGWMEIAFASWEALPGELDSGLRLGIQPRRGPGGWVEGERWGGSAAPPWLRIGGGALLRGSRWRISLGAARESMVGAARIEVQGGAEIQVTRDVLVCSRLWLDPGESRGPLTATAGVFAGRGPWMGSLVLGPGPRDLGAGVGVRLEGHLIWTAGYADHVTEVGIAWRFGRGELRAATARHPYLGTRSGAALVVGGLGP